MASGKSSGDSSSKSKACVSRRFRAPAEKLFDAWLIPDLIGQWMFGPNLRDEEVIRLTVDARQAGAFSFVVRRAGQELNHRGVYLELERPHRLSFTWQMDVDAVHGDGPQGDSPQGDGAPSRVLVEISGEGGRSDLTLIHELDPAWAGSASQIEESWQAMLSALAKVIELPISEESEMSPTSE